MPIDDAQLAELKRGDAAVVERLVAEYEGPLFRYFLTIHGDPGLAGEQSADCFVELLRSLGKMRGGAGQLRAFVYAVARNVERRRWRSRRDALPLEEADGCADAAPCPAGHAELREEVRCALEAIRTLDPATRDVFVLAFVEQLPLAEVAATLGQPLGTVKSRIHRGRQELKTKLRTSEAQR